MEALSEELMDHRMYVELMDELVEENDMEMKHRLQKADTYGRFINEQASVLMDRAIDFTREENVAFPIASAIILAAWKEEMFS